MAANSSDCFTAGFNSLIKWRKKSPSLQNSIKNGFKIRVSMDQATHNKIVSFIWGIADDVLRDLFKRGKYPDVILPMCVIRRMDAVLEPIK